MPTFPRFRRRPFGRKSPLRPAYPSLEVMETRQLLSGGPLTVTITELGTSPLEQVTIVDNGPGDTSSTVGIVDYSTPANDPFSDFSITGFQATSNRTASPTPTQAKLIQSGTVTRTTTTGGNQTLLIQIQDFNYLYPASQTVLESTASTTFTNGTANVDNGQFQSFYNTTATGTTASPIVTLTSSGGATNTKTGTAATTPLGGTAPFNLANTFAITLAPSKATGNTVTDFRSTGDTVVPGTNGSLAGNVYLDNNLDGSLDTGDSAIGGVLITLTGTDADGNAIDETTTTAANGTYDFTNLTTGVYTVTETQPTGYSQGVNTPGIPDDGIVTGDTISQVIISGGQNLVNYNFGETLPVTIGDFVWDDQNADGIQDAGEPGIDGVTLTLTGTNAYGASVTDTTTTSGNGAYLFSEVPGTYVVTVNASNFTGSGALVGYDASPTLQGGNPALDSNPNPSNTTPGYLPPGSSDLTVDFGYYMPVTTAITTSAAVTGGGVVGTALLTDTAELTGGSNPTGTITFTLTGPDGNPVILPPADATMTVMGNGDYTTPTAITATEVGTYTWHAVYSGDTLNNGAADNGTNESVTTVVASPAINTSQQPASATVGTSIADQATVSGGYNPTGTVTFNLYSNSAGTGTPLYTDANVPLSDGSATSVGYTATATGTDYWVATYNGDSNNASVTSGTASEPVVVTAASPSINTAQQPATATVGGLIADKATVSGGYNPSGTVSFALYANSAGTGTPLYTDANVPLSGGSATSVGYTATATGTDYWVATYNGDSNNAAVTSGTASEPVVVSAASPTINTSQQPATATVGTSIADQATVSGGYNPSGTVTFNLYSNSAGTGTPLYTDANVALSGGTATSVGYTATATGTDYWVATYNGDSNNAAVTSGTALEPVAVTTASPSINTAQQPATAVVGTSIADQATVSGGYNPTGTVTFNLYSNSAGTGTPLYTDANVPLSGGTATSVGYTATATGTDYWVATYNGDSNNASVTSGTASEPVLVSPASPTINTTQQPATATVGTSIADQATVSGGYNPTGTVTFNLYSNSAGTGTPLYTDANVPLSGGSATSVGYIATATGTDYWVATYNGDSNNASVTSGTASEPVSVTTASPAINTSQQPASAVVGTSIADKATVSGGYNPSGTVSFALYANSAGTGTPLYTDANVPLSGGSATSVGYTATATGTDYWVATYNGDSNNASVTSGTALEPVSITSASPTINTVQQPATAVVGTSIADKATVSGGDNPTGTVSFALYANSAGTGTPLYTDANVPLSGGSATSVGYTATATGTDYWVATYNGDSNNASVTSGTASEPVLVSPASPAINTSQQPATALVGSSIADKATVSGGYNPSGTVTFYLYGNSAGTGTPLYTDPNVALSGGTATSVGYTATATGTDYWVATYNGDSNNASVTSGAASEPVSITTASPSINTAQQPATATVGTSIADKATVSGGYNPSGTVTFKLYSNSAGTGTPLYTDANVPLSGGTATSVGYTATATGTDYWVATYNGDSNNASVTSGAASEPVSITTASPSITTAQQPATAVVGTSIADKATVSGGYNPTGTVTFKLYSNSAGTGTPLYTDANVALSGGTATSVGYTATATGTDYWVATYNGDGNNAAVTSGAASEPVVVTAASPSINTAQQPATATVGTSIADKATVSGGDNPSGTVTFKLYSNSAGTGTPLYTDTNVPLSGGTSTSVGYTATATGTDYWVATYNGDSNNASVTSGAASEPVVITQASPSITTTPGGPVKLGNILISGFKYLDQTGNGYSSDDTPQSGVTIDLYESSNGNTGLQIGGGGDTLIATATTATNGAYSFTVTTAATYYVQEVVPTAYIQTGGGPNGSAGDTYYTINATAGNSYSGIDFDDYLIPTCAPINVSYKVTTPSNCSTTVTDLGGNTQQGDTVTATFTVTAGMTDQLTLVSYYAPGSSFSDATAYQQVIYQEATGTFGPGTHSLTVAIPKTYYQIDFVCGPAINQFEPNENNDAYGPDSAEILYHAEDRFISSDNGGTTCPTTAEVTNNTGTTTPAQTTSATPTTPLSDTANLSGGYNPTGTITFYLFAPGVTPNANDSNNVYSDVVTVSGNNTYSTGTGTKPGGYVPTVAGTYEWVAVYGGDTNNKGVAGTLGSEPEMAGESPSISTTPSTTSATASSSLILKDTASLAAGSNPTGTITFTLYNPSGALVDTETVNVSGDGSYTTPTGYSLPSIGAVTGTYQWDSSYSGNSSNYSASDNNDPNEQVVVGAASPSISTTASSSNTQCTSALTLKDMASLTGGFDPTGTITFTLYNPKGTLVDTETVNVNGNGTYTTPTGYTLPTTGAVSGTYQWDSSYSGDHNNNVATDNNDSNEQVVVGSSVCSSQTQNCSFWCGSQGQSLINCLNGGSSCKNLGNWLAATCPNLFGNLKGCTNTQVASYCKTLSYGNSNQQACGQVLSTALCAYVTNSNLAGGSYGSSCGFTVSSGGLGADTYNVGYNGSALGLSNNSTCGILDLLTQIDSQSKNGSINSSACNAANSLCSAINSI